MLTRVRKIAIVLAVTAATTVAARPASAQAPAVDLGVGYQIAHIPENWNPLGFNVDVGFTVLEPWSIVAEAGLTRDSEDDVTLNDWNFGVGPRFSTRMAPIGGHIQFLVGGLRRSVSIEDLADESETKFMIQPGVALTYDLMQNAGLKVDLAYRRVFSGDDTLLFEEDGENGFRLVFGVQIGFPRP